MNDKKTKFFVGFFVASGLAIIVGTVIWLGMSNFFQKGDHYSIYFDESVQGLNVEAPVKYRGVPVGRVQNIKVAADAHLIEVVIELDQDLNMREKVYAQLKVVGITGNMFIELDHFLDETQTVQETELSFPTEFPVIPSRSSEIKQLFSSIDEIVQKLRTIDIEGLSNGFLQTMEHIDNTIVLADIGGLSKEFQTTLKTFNSVVSESDLPQMMHQLNSLIVTLDNSVQALDLAGLSDEAQKSLTSLRQESQTLISTTKPLIKNASQTFGTAENTLDNFNQQILLMSQQMERTNSKLNTLIDHLNDRPSQIIFSDAPPRRLQ